MMRARSADRVSASVSSRRLPTADWIAPPVLRARRALDEPLTLDPIKQSREIVLRKQKRALELEWPQPSLARPFELEQDIIPSQWRQPCLFQRRFHARKREPLGLEEPRPGQHDLF